LAFAASGFADLISAFYRFLHRFCWLLAIIYARMNRCLIGCLIWHGFGTIDRYHQLQQLAIKHLLFKYLSILRGRSQMKFRRLGWLALVFSLMFILAACGGDDDKDGDNGGDSGGVNLSQTVTGGSEEAGMLTVKYPEGWVSRVVEYQVFVGDSEATLDKIDGDENPEGDEIGGIVLGLPAEAMSFFVEGDDPSAVDILTALTGTVSDEETTFDLGDPEEFTANGRNGALVSGSGTKDGATFDALFAGAFAGDDFVIVVMRATEGNVGQYEDTAKAMVGEATFEFTAPSG
jgi:hypothetical protein